jgi:urea transport system ATP-binding protein
MKNLMGLLRPAGGSIRLGEREVAHLPANRRARAGVALVPQGRQIFPKLTVEENLRIGLMARADGRRTVPTEVYDTFPVLKEMARRMGGDLSGGQQQQLAIARALVGEPRVLLLDEPTEGIQPNIIQQIGAVLRKLVEERGMAVVLVEQYLAFVREFGHGFYVMNRGRVVAEGDTSALSADIISRHLSV